MSNPIPLSAPDGTVRAWACGACREVYGPDTMDATVDDCEVSAASCCRPRCRLCLAQPQGYSVLCSTCLADGRHALEALAAVGMAVAAWEMAETAGNLALARDGYRMSKSADEWQAGLEECAAALCGVDAETVRGWGR